jgi:prepilin-type N-terminal cleavage/methylation domain-containing protein
MLPRGFTLVELAIVITVSALMLVGLTHLYDTLRMHMALKTTRQRIEEIQQALDDYADKNERLPCPQAAKDWPSGETPTDCSKSDLQPGERDVAVGIVPAAALGLAPREAKDGWDNLLTYAVSAALTKDKGMKGVEPPVGAIGLVNGYGENILEKPDTGRYIIMSHGPHGFGAFTPRGSKVPCQSGTLSEKNCHAQGVFVSAPWNSHPGASFFDNIVVNDGGRRQARLLAHLDYCNRQGKYYAPTLFLADADGCVMDDRLHGACTIESAYMTHGGSFDSQTGNWEELPQLGWAPAQTQFWPTGSPPIEEGTCKCDKTWQKLVVGIWELPPRPHMTPQQSCQFAAKREFTALVPIGVDHCTATPPFFDMKENLWGYEYVTDGKLKVWQESGYAWKAADQRQWAVLPIFTRDPDSGALIKAFGAAHIVGNKTRHLIWTTPLVEINRKRTVYTCLKKSQAMLP